MAARSKRITSRGALLVVDVSLVDRVWSAMPASGALEIVRNPSAARPTDASPVPGVPEPADAAGLDVALRAFTSKKLFDRPLDENLRAKRALGIPWKWITAIPNARDEARADERLLRWAEVTRVPGLSAGDVMVIGSCVEGAMVGAGELNDSFARFGTDAFADSLLAMSLGAGDVQARLAAAWDGDLAPLLAMAGVDDEPELATMAATRLQEIRDVIAFARRAGLSVLPSNEALWSGRLASRAAARSPLPRS
jgi:hypothetical protein